MQDAELRGKLLTTFYELRYNAGGWVPTSDMNVSGADHAVSRQAIGGVCQQLADAGLIEWKPLIGSDEGFVVGMAKITGLGVDVVAGSRSSTIDVCLPNAGQPDLSPAPGSLTKEVEAEANEPAYLSEAAKAVYEAIESLVAAGKRAYLLSVPSEAENILVRSSKGRLSRHEASTQIKAAISGLAKSGKVEIHTGSRNDWLIKEPFLPEAEGMATASQKIFVVHGHDEGARETVARFLERLGFEAIILHEQANQGRTIIEKIEAHGDVGFAVILLTPDDEGATKGGTPQPRARQNVVLELGYFIGRLGREHVCALKRGELEIPSDFGGVVYEPFDAGNGWKLALARELKAAGHDIDWNMVMSP